MSDIQQRECYAQPDDSKPHVCDGPYKDIERVMADALCVGVNYDDMRVYIDLKNMKAADSAYALLVAWRAAYGPSGADLESMEKARRRVVFQELYKEFGNVAQKGAE